LYGQKKEKMRNREEKGRKEGKEQTEEETFVAKNRYKEYQLTKLEVNA